ncbi:MAG: succinate dehydrogenase, cytochrome b556 subunit [Burkholderiaceae bacterium]
MSEAVDKSAPRVRPKFRNINLPQIAAYRLPVPGIVSILHRASGALMFVVGIPFILYLLQQSISSEISFDHYRALVSHWFAKLVLLALIWAYLHHFCAGIRYLLLDVHIGIDKAAARTSAGIVLIVSLVLTFLVALKLFGVF